MNATQEGEHPVNFNGGAYDINENRKRAPNINITKTIVVPLTNRIAIKWKIPV